MESNMNFYRTKIKEDIQILIQDGNLQKAKDVLKEYEEIVLADIDIYSIKGVIFMLEGHIDEAKSIMKEGLSLYKDNFDLLYNLIYLYEAEGNCLEAYRYCKEALNYCNNEMKDDLINKIKCFEKNNPNISFEHQTKNKSYNPKISIISFVYNSKEYIEKCAESVINQSFKDIEWIILDNGSNDGTSEILQKYANNDTRVKVFKNKANLFENKDKKNIHFEGYNLFTNYRKNLKSEYVAILDSDDFLDQDFCKDLYIAAKKYNSDIALAGSTMFKDENPNLMSRRCPIMLKTEEIKEVGEHFSELYVAFRPLWGKLIRTDIYINTLFHGERKNLLNAGDTYLSLKFLENSKSLISLNKELYFYRVRNLSHYNSQLNKKRYLDYLIIYEESRRLINDWGKLNDKNSRFIKEVLYYSIKDCIDIAVNCEEGSLEERIESITSVLRDEKLREIFSIDEKKFSIIDEGLNAINKLIMGRK